MHVVVLGAGYAGLSLVRRLESRLPPAVDVTLVNDGAEHVLIHEAHRAIRRPALADAISVSIPDVLDRTEFVNARVDSVEFDAGRAVLDDGEALSWDYGAVCLGSETEYYGIEGLREHATPMKSLADAATIREGFRSVREAGGRAVVGGAGLSGVQVAGELTALAREEEFAVPEEVEVVLLERFDGVAPNFPANFRRAVHDELLERDVDVRTGTAVERVGPERVVTEEGELRYDQLIWTGGITGPAAADGNRPTVRADLRAADRTLALGDAARIVDADGEPVPASASAAIREAKTAAENLSRLVEADRSESVEAFRPRLSQYRFDVPGWIVSIGEGTVAQVGSTVLRGSAAKAAKASVGAGYLTSIGAARNAGSLAEEELR
ncbi:NAD(P)/FAD-dependent oxidoreductase [Halorarum halobium]|uniref:NAD(P)/FAD-dependent oxidoreductase n=1 Tax=Halorarum halobium TaxID=3075121 RepID=UPI0028B0E674|nr:FAD-dependent oxidoreductase [Halobaculum sp. XH14]